MTTNSEVMDLSVGGYANDARRGDLEAAQLMHAILADFIERSDIPPQARKILVTMHRQIADGMDAAAASLTAAPPNRRITRERQGRIVNEVLARVFIWNIADKFRAELTARGHSVPAKLNMSAIYRTVAAEFGVTADYVKKLARAKN